MQIRKLDSDDELRQADVNPTRDRAEEIATILDKMLTSTESEFQLDLPHENLRLLVDREEGAELRDALRALVESSDPAYHRHVPSRPDYVKELTVWLRLE